MSEGDPENKSLAMRLAAQSVMQNPATKQNMVQPSTSSPIESNVGGMSPEMGDSPYIPPSLAGMKPKAFDDDGLGDFDEGILKELQNTNNPNPKPNISQPPQPPPQNPQVPTTYQAHPTNHQAVFSPDLQGAILRKLSTIEKAVLATAESVKNIEKKVDLLEELANINNNEES